jgi:hypothetical protein
MKNYFRGAAGAAILASLAIACSETPSAPTAPAAVPGDNSAAADGSNLKVTAPVPTAPVNDFQTDGNPTLTAQASTGKFTTVALSYQWELYNAANQLVQSATTTGPSFLTTANLDFDARYTWRVRAAVPSQNAVGPWSTVASFKSPQGGYIKTQEIFDPLTNGKTVAGFTRGITFMGAAGVRLDGQESVVEYVMPQTLTGGEFSTIITNLGNGSEEWKTKVMSMLAGDGVNVTDNEYRVTLDKRTSWLGQGSPARYTFCVRPNCFEPNAGPRDWNRSKTYFWKFTWGNNQSRLVILDGGSQGVPFVDISQSYIGTWNPAKMLVRLGSVGGRAGSDTNPGTTIRNVWVSAKPRPAFKDDK